MKHLYPADCTVPAMFVAWANIAHKNEFESGSTLEKPSTRHNPWAYLTCGDAWSVSFFRQVVWDSEGGNGDSAADAMRGAGEIAENASLWLGKHWQAEIAKDEDTPERSYEEILEEVGEPTYEPAEGEGETLAESGDLSKACAHSEVVPLGDGWGRCVECDDDGFPMDERATPNFDDDREEPTYEEIQRHIADGKARDDSRSAAERSTPDQDTGILQHVKELEAKYKAAIVALREWIEAERRDDKLGTLWALHVIGPDDIVPMPSRRVALEAAENLEPHREQDPPAWGEVIKWPHSPSAHARGIEDGLHLDFLPRWMKDEDARDLARFARALEPAVSRYTVPSGFRAEMGGREYAAGEEIEIEGSASGTITVELVR